MATDGDFQGDLRPEVGPRHRVGRDDADRSASLSVCIVVPAYNAADTIGEMIRAANLALGEGHVLVIDAGSTDETGTIAREQGAEVISLASRAGPSEARNLGVRQTSADIILFIDSDCVPQQDAVDRVRRAFLLEPGLVALSGSYDGSPPEPGFFSQYLNLRHHLTHQLASRENATFWAGCGAVRREAFLEAGGFDEERYPEAQIEDIELGLRLRKIGATRLEPDLQVTHLKPWSLWSVISTDIKSRAIPWATLILEQGEIPDDLNLRVRQRIAAFVATLLLLGLPLAVAAAVHLLSTRHATPTGTASGAGLVLIGFAALAVASLIVNLDLARGFARLRGIWFALGGWLFHQVHLAYSAITFGVCWLQWKVTARR